MFRRLVQRLMGTDPNPWKNLRRGMLPEHVASLLGPPLQDNPSGNTSFERNWYYSEGYVRFDEDGFLMDWTEPDADTTA